jgi:hypothetical protein
VNNLIKQKGMIYVALDGDGIGRQVGRAVLSDDSDSLHAISARIDAAQALVTRWIKEMDGTKISGGGDECTMAIPRSAMECLESLRRDIEYAFGFTVSVGIGRSLSEAGKALLIAKLKGKNRIVKFDKTARKEIQAVKVRAKKGTMKSMEEYKLADAYLSKKEELEKSRSNPEKIIGSTSKDVRNLGKAESVGDPCPYCEKSDGVDPKHCRFCHDVGPQAGEETCPYCKGSQNDPALGPKEPEIAEEDCAFCKDGDQAEKDGCPFCSESPESEAPGLGMPEITSKDPNTGIPSLVSPDSNNETSVGNAEAEKEQADVMGMNPPEIGKPAPDDHAPIGQNAPMDVVPKGDPDPNQRLDDQRDVELVPAPEIDPEDNHSNEALTAIANEIKDEETPNKVDIGEENIPSGDAVEGNVSRPNGFNQNTPGDMGEEGANELSDANPGGQPESGDDEPDFGAILEEGLDHHAGSIQKDKAIQMVSQALREFKGCKNILEQNREQMPQLYQASLSILKAMIEMAGVLNLASPSAEQDSSLGQVQAEMEPEQKENEWHDPFPTHPDHGGEPKPGHSPSTKPSPSQTNADGAGKDKTVGQPVGKLPTKNTTEHIARTPLPIGAVNAKGQKKVMDDQGKVRFVNMKQGLVQGASGVPVKPESR